MTAASARSRPDEYVAAARVYLGAATVKTHASRVLLGLGLRDRVPAVAFPYESGLITPGR